MTDQYILNKIEELERNAVCVGDEVEIIRPLSNGMAQIIKGEVKSVLKRDLYGDKGEES